MAYSKAFCDTEEIIQRDSTGFTEWGKPRGQERKKKNLISPGFIEFFDTSLCE